MTNRSKMNYDSNWITFGGSVGTRLLFTTVFCPLDYAKTLIQIGFEPIPPKQTKTLFGKPALGLPNVFSYVKYIHSVDGTVGCFRGLSPRLCSTFLTTVSHSFVIDRFKIPEAEINEQDLDEEKRLNLFAKTLSRDVLATSTAIVISQPFYVVAARLMAQFIGRETKYSGIFSSLYTIFKEEGIGGWFSGLVPRLVGEITTVFLVSSITFSINSYLVPDDRSIQQVMSVGVDFLIKNITYPFQLVSVCMTVNNSGLKAGSSPFMNNYSGNWLKCWDDLSKTNQTKRGSGLLWRYYYAKLEDEIQYEFPSPPKTATFSSINL